MPFRVVVFLLAVVLAAIVGYSYATADAVPKAAGQAQAYWQEVEGQFRRRAEFVPTVLTAIEAINPAQKDIAAKVKSTQAGVLALPPDPAAPASREKFRAFMQVQDKLSEDLGSVMDMLRTYPDKARSEPIRKVFDELEQKETRIVVARSNYVAQATLHNQLLQNPPDSWIAAFLHPQAKPLVASFDPDKQ